MMTFDSGNIRSDNESVGIKNFCDEKSLHHETRLLFKTTLTHPGNSKSEQQENNLMPTNCLIKKFLPKRSLLQSFSSTRLEIVLMSIKYQPNDSHVCVGLFIRCAYYNFRSWFFLENKFLSKYSSTPWNANQKFFALCFFLPFSCAQRWYYRCISTAACLDLPKLLAISKGKYISGRWRGQEERKEAKSRADDRVGENLLFGSHSQQQNKNIAIHIFK